MPDQKITQVRDALIGELNQKPTSSITNPNRNLQPRASGSITNPDGRLAPLTPEQKTSLVDFASKNINDLKRWSTISDEAVTKIKEELSYILGFDVTRLKMAVGLSPNLKLTIHDNKVKLAEITIDGLKLDSPGKKKG